MAWNTGARSCLGTMGAIALALGLAATAHAHEWDHGWGRYAQRGHHWHHAPAHKVVRKARPSRAAIYRHRLGSWHCNPWHGPSMLHGQRFVLGKGYHHGYCLEHQTHVAQDWRLWQEHERARGRVHWHSHREHNWLKNADLRSRVR